MGREARCHSRASVAYSGYAKGLAQVSVAQGSSSGALWASACLTQAARTLWAWGTQRPMRLPCVGVHLRAWDWRIPWWLQRYIHSNNFNDCF